MRSISIRQSEAREFFEKACDGRHDENEKECFNLELSEKHESYLARERSGETCNDEYMEYYYGNITIGTRNPERYSSTLGNYVPRFRHCYERYSDTLRDFYGFGRFHFNH